MTPIVLCQTFHFETKSYLMQTRLLLSSLFFFLFFAKISSQTDTIPRADFTIKGAAIGISAPEMIEQLMVTMPGLGSNAKSMMSEQSIKTYLMPPRKVGERGTITSYILSAAMEFYANFRKNYKVNLSPDFVALNLVKEGKPDIKNSLRFLVTDGTVSADAVPYDSPKIPNSATSSDRFRISNYLQIFKETHRESQKVFEVQKALMRGNPVIVEMNVPRAFEKVNNTRFWTSIGSQDDPNGTGQIMLPFMVVGYNLELEAFEVVSSWGTEWGTNGYLWLDFDDFGELAQNGYVLVPTP
jgi:Papain family cysteine protease